MNYIYGIILILSGLMISDDFLRRRFPSLKEIFDKLSQVKLVFGVIILLGALYLIIRMIIISFSIFLIFGYVLVILFLNAVLIVTPSLSELLGEDNNIVVKLKSIDQYIRTYSDPIGWITFAHGLLIFASSAAFDVFLSDFMNNLSQFM